MDLGKKLLTSGFLATGSDNKQSLDELRAFVSDTMSNEHVEFGLLDWATETFVYYDAKLPRLLNGFFNTAFLEHPKLDFFFQHLSQLDCRFVKGTIVRVMAFFDANPDCNRSQYRLTLDGCLRNNSGQYIRIMCHTAFLPASETLGDNLVRFYLHLIDADCKPTAPMRSFCRIGVRKPVLFKQGDSSILYFSPQRMSMIELLARGKQMKEIANELKLTESTVYNTLTTCRGRSQLTSNPQLIHYAHCFRCL
ncbi:LuxR C-terminal-related transcriptional regulator [Mangrovibacterium lignilyticum]|uniref:LuxR C-terminal-related transcriptional regulator n=1 Tax=Mangrovibacterium lignilyticum TaxID=2668052 RepID=UPI0013D169B3|nr:LuxR C-terminal-related transcriptional regulator [Mangrovibacterium lignilyticum]